MYKRGVVIKDRRLELNYLQLFIEKILFLFKGELLNTIQR